MANRNDYRNIKKRRNYLPKFNITFNRLPEYLEETNEEVDSLQISNTLVGRIIRYKNEEVNSGELIIGEEYIIEQLEFGDDFSNVGYVEDGTPFIATGTTPNDWSSFTTVRNTNVIFTEIYNDLDPNFTVEGSGNNYRIKITNGLFNVNKTFPNIPGGSHIAIEDLNTVYFNTQNTPRYFKIEVYV